VTKGNTESGPRGDFMPLSPATFQPPYTLFTGSASGLSAWRTNLWGERSQPLQPEYRIRLGERIDVEGNAILVDMWIT
jgi:hypothetical protein